MAKLSSSRGSFREPPLPAFTGSAAASISTSERPYSGSEGRFGAQAGTSVLFAPAGLSEEAGEGSEAHGTPDTAEVEVEADGFR